MPKKISKSIEKGTKTDNPDDQKYILQLYVTGLMPNSVRAINNIDIFCEKYLKGRYELEIIDLHKHPEIAIREHIVSVPLLIRKFPLPEERLVGDLSNIERILKGLALLP